MHPRICFGCRLLSCFAGRAAQLALHVALRHNQSTAKSVVKLSILRKLPIFLIELFIVFTDLSYLPSSFYPPTKLVYLKSSPYARDSKETASRVLSFASQPTQQAHVIQPGTVNYCYTLLNVCLYPRITVDLLTASVR
jgi:hypothetical protein